MAYVRFDSVSKPFNNRCHVTSSKLNSNSFRYHNSASITKTTEYSISNVSTYLILLCLCCLLPIGSCVNDSEVSQNSVNVLLRPESSLAEKPLKALSRPQPDPVEPFRLRKLQNRKAASQKDKNRKGLATEKLSELTIKENPEPKRENKSQIQQRQAVTKSKPQEHTGPKPQERTEAKPQERKGPKPQERTGAKPQERTVTKPQERTGAKPQERTGIKLLERAAAKPQERIGAKPQERTGAKPQERTGTKPLERPGAKPQERTGTKPQERTEPKPQERTKEKPQERTGAKPQERKGPKPQERTGPKPQERTEARPQERTGAKPQERTGARPQERTEAKPQERTKAKPQERTGARPQERTGAKPQERTEAKPQERTGAKPQERTGAKPQERTGAKPETPSEATANLTKTVKQNQSRRQQSFPNELLEKKELCPLKSLVHYNVTFFPMWSSKRFPKMYPTYRPNAQWSKAIGRTHDYSYSMWKLDTFASPAVKSFAEEGYAADFDTETQGENGIFDMFTMPAIYKGVGRSKGNIFLDGMHPLVSLMVKIIPSPDWFVGASGLNLCSNGKWRKKAIMKLFPVDAGTDQGLTFTSPNWPSYPPKKITRITASFPHHEASSFYYPKLKKLPRIGYVIFHKTTESKITFKRRKPYKIHLAGVSDRSLSVVMHKEMKILNGSHKPTTLVQSDQRPEAKKPESASVISNQEPQPNASVKLAITDNDPGTPLDCLVSNWGHWSECSKTCGFGRRERHRFVTQQKKNRGLICPKLKEEELCGSMRNCKWNHFQPFRWQTLQRPRLALSKRH